MKKNYCCNFLSRMVKLKSMHSFKLESNLKLLSVNSAFSTLKNRQRVRSQAYHAFAASIARLLCLKRKSFLEFDSYFDPKLHEIHAELIFYTKTMYTNDGKISQRSGDLGNIEKCLTDCILIGKVDDSFITKWILEKRHANEDGFSVTYNIVNRISL